MSEYNVAGVSRLNGQVKVRFAASIEYVEKLAKAGNVDIKLLEAPTTMTREQLTEWLKTTSIYEDPDAKAAIDERSEMYNSRGEPQPKENTTRVKKTKVTPTTQAEVTEHVVDLMAALTARIPTTAE
jgi:hypothetical protein